MEYPSSANHDALNDDHSPLQPTIQVPVISENLDDLLTPGVIVEVDPDVAESLGAFLETALSEEDAWESNIDLDPEQLEWGKDA